MIKVVNKIMDFKEILGIIAQGASQRETVEIYYPKTQNTKAGWREVEPYSLATDVGEEGEHLVYGADRISPGHIFNGFTIKSNDDHCDSFIIGKIKKARPTGHQFKPRRGWKVEFEG
ncbi:MAG: hypothetical protein NTV62_01785 [Candidatus Gribaldobacteria bacterium]|nr:hypothetical protein [Candidatus Gribaldobacteria bacterium]